MDILNKKERYSAFMLFLLMFVLTTGILISALFFNYRLPLKENEVLKAENEQINNQFAFQKNFTDKMGNIKKLLDSLERISPERFPSLDQKIGFKVEELVSMKEKVPADSIGSLKLYDNVIFNINSLLICRRSLLQLNDSKSSIDKLNNDIEKLQRENKDLYNDLAICRQVSNSNR